MIDRAHDLPITQQAKALNISRGSVYYLPRPVPEADLAIMRRLDRLHLEFPFAGSRMLKGLLAAEGSKIGRRHVKTLMRRMGIEALYRRPRTTKPEPGHKIYPYLLRASRSRGRTRCGRWTSPTSRWSAASSIWPSCSIGSAVACCRGACRYDGGGILRRDAGECTLSPRQAGDLQHGSRQPVHRCGIHRRADQKRDAVSMDGKGAWRDNVFVERLWRSVKYEEVYLRAYDTASEARARSGATSTSTIAPAAFEP